MKERLLSLPCDLFRVDIPAFIIATRLRARVYLCVKEKSRLKKAQTPHEIWRTIGQVGMGG